MSVKLRPTRILLKGTNVFEEGRAAAIITPGAMVALNSSGDLIPHNVAGGAAEKQFAVEDALQGRTISNDYAIGELVFTTIAKPGDVVFAWLAAGKTVVPGTALTSNGDGTLKPAAGTDSIVGRSLETLSTTATAAPSARLRVRIV